MGSLQQVSSSPFGASKFRAERNRHMTDEHREVRDGVVGEGQGLSKEDESRINEGVNDGVGRLLLQQQPVVRWERFLPVRSLKVLLVESDDSTRQLVSALLRNSSYEVITAANGEHAWKILEDLTNHIDLILTEVVMPCLSGTGLLSKIMGHKARKVVPVIMMSSNDSMHTVFSCLSKGAVDFLVKPIRKNELKNLWQHVWRRCHNSSGSESGIQTEKYVKSKSGGDSPNNIGSNDEDDNDNGIIGLNISDGSDNGSGTQNSWTKRPVEVESLPLLSPSDQPADQHDSPCAQITPPETEAICKGWVPMTDNSEYKEHNGIADVYMGKDLEIGVPMNPGPQHESYPTEKVSTKLTSESVERLPESDSNNKGMLGLESSNLSDKSGTQATDLIGLIANSTIAQETIRVTDGSMELPSLKLSLKRLRSTEEGGRNFLKRSDLSAFSAFSRYPTSVPSTQAPILNGGSCSPTDTKTSEALKIGSTDNVINDVNAAPLTGSNGSSDNNDMGSSTESAFTKPTTFKEKMVSESPFKSAHTSAFHPVQLRTSSQAMHEKTDGAVVTQPRDIQHQVQMQHYEHRYLSAHNMQQMQVPPASLCGSSINLTGPNESNPDNYSRIGSNSGSNHGSSRENGSSTAVNGRGVYMEHAKGIAEINGNSGGDGSGGSSRVDQDRCVQREAALNKFRQKRKERNFEKKVRYHSRQRLAEQRPRMRGQFVRRTEFEQTGQDADS